MEYAFFCVGGMCVGGAAAHHSSDHVSVTYVNHVAFPLFRYCGLFCHFVGPLEWGGF